MNKRFKHIIFSYLDKNCQVTDNILICDDCLRSLSLEMGLIFDIKPIDALALFKEWIEPKLTTEDKRFFRELILPNPFHRYMRYRFMYLDNELSYVHIGVDYLNEIPKYQENKLAPFE